MFILRDLLPPLQQAFPDNKLGRKRSQWFVYTLLAVIVPFTSSITSNLLRTLNILFGFSIGNHQLFYTFMGSPKLPWERLWKTVWSLVQEPTTDGRVIVALDDMINPKTGTEIFACGHFHDHASKMNQTSYAWSQCIVSIGLFKPIKGRWACLPLSWRFYLMKKDIEAAEGDKKHPNARFRGKPIQFASKMEQAAEMLMGVYNHYGVTVLVVTDSWFGNDGLWSRLEGAGEDFHLLSRLRTNNNLYAMPVSDSKPKRGRPRKYGKLMGTVSDCAVSFRELADDYQVNLYGKKRTVTAYSELVMRKTLKRPVRVVWVFRRTRYIALFTTDLSLSVEQIIEYYGARWKIESGFKEIKQEIGSARSQTRDAQAVTNHLSFCMMAVSLTWIYADRLQHAPNRRHHVEGRASFAFSDVRRVIAKAALDPDFQRVCPIPEQRPRKSIISELLQMVA